MHNTYSKEFKRKVFKSIENDAVSTLYTQVSDWVSIEDAGRVLDIDSLVVKGSLENTGPSLAEMAKMPGYNRELHSVLALQPKKGEKK